MTNETTSTEEKSIKYFAPILTPQIEGILKKEGLNLEEITYHEKSMEVHFYSNGQALFTSVDQRHTILLIPSGHKTRGTPLCFLMRGGKLVESVNVFCTHVNTCGALVKAVRACYGANNR